MVDKKLAELGLSLPAVPATAGSFVGYKKIGNLVLKDLAQVNDRFDEDFVSFE